MILAISLMTSASHAASDSSNPAPKNPPVTGTPIPKSSAKSKGGDPAFDSTRAFRYLMEQCALGPRNPESEGHRRAIEYFKTHFTSLGFAPVLQTFMHTD
ncbi:MAG: hypothetical protein M3Y08_10950, partial [Fibrobacterota bacterium]|nr:hypothetical protein [Fibrobacterota bacterium]